MDPRLLSPEQAARYLGLGSRWAIYRLIASGQLPAVRLAGKLRLDRADLDTLITALKTAPAPRASATTRPTRAVPSQLAPRTPVATRLRRVTFPVTSLSRDG